MRSMLSKVACYQSHRRAWKRIVDEEWRYAMVLEDDADLDLEVSKGEILKVLEDVPSDWDLLYLGLVNEVVRVL